MDHLRGAGAVFSTVTSQPEASRPQVLLCVESVCSPLHLQGLSGCSGSPPQSKDMRLGDRQSGDLKLTLDAIVSPA